jgi:aryl-alcohol dehydrogenase-like predicted oxidoreductase
LRIRNHPAATTYRSARRQIDTADMYSGGESESTLGQSFKNLGLARKDYVLVTEVYSRMGQGRNDVGASRGHIMDAVEASPQRLQTDYIDVPDPRDR